MPSNQSKDKTLIEDLIQSYRLINDFDGVLIYLNKLILMDNTNIEALLFKAAIFSKNEEYTKSNLLYSKIIKLIQAKMKPMKEKVGVFII